MVDILLNEVNVEKAVEFVKKSIIDLLKGKYPITDFVTSKTLKGTYKGDKLTTTKDGKKGEKGTWPWDDVECSIAHVKLCQRMKERDPGNAPQSNDRIPYTTVEMNDPRNKLLQGEKIEHVDYIKENKLKVDYMFYLTNQIKNPTVQFLEHLIDNPEGMFKEAQTIETNRKLGNVSILNYIKVKPKNGTKKQELNLNVSKRKSKNLSKYYINEDNIDLEKVGLGENINEEEKGYNSEDEKSEDKVRKEQLKKLFLEL
tara:strand:- start:222 stop:992 length:771 start_codon:yes stop_codon:yes gene_type:complete